MLIGSVGANPAVAAMTRTPERAEAPGPDHDGDSDDKSGALKSATAKGVGNLVDTTA